MISKKAKTIRKTMSAMVIVLNLNPQKASATPITIRITLKRTLFFSTHLVIIPFEKTGQALDEYASTTNSLFIESKVTDWMCISPFVSV
jgi:hypothetical protein